MYGAQTHTNTHTPYGNVCMVLGIWNLEIGVRSSEFVGMPLGHHT